MFNKTRFSIQALLFSMAFAAVSCASTPEPQVPLQAEQEPVQEEIPSYNPETQFPDGTPIVDSQSLYDQRDTLLCIFAGDIMAHTPNWSHGNFDLIYKDIKADLQASDLAFANFETPVDESKDYSTYPNFNVKNAYADAAIDAGFNVFSLVNNHTNDQGLSGIKATKQYFDSRHDQTLAASLTDPETRVVYSAGIKPYSGAPFTYQVIQKDGWTVLFMAVTEVMNRGDYAAWQDVIGTTSAARARFFTELERIREENPCDLFVLSIHCSDPEYILTMRESQTKFYHDLLEHQVDIVWVNHPHVAKKWEVVYDRDYQPVKMIFYAQGNTISAQRYRPNFDDPSESREYTGEGFMTKVRFEKTADGVRIVQVDPVLLTTYVMTNGFCAIKKLDDSLIDYLNEVKRNNWAQYMTARWALMEDIRGQNLWQ